MQAPTFFDHGDMQIIVTACAINCGLTVAVVGGITTLVAYKTLQEYGFIGGGAEIIPVDTVPPADDFGF